MWVLSAKAVDGPKLTDNFRLGSVLGKGAFGVVYTAQAKATNHLYACKSIAKAKLVSKEDVEDVQREVAVLKLVSDHPNVAELLCTYEDSAQVHLILELCRGGELFDRVVSKGTFSERMAADYFRTMVVVVDHLHQLGVMHRDIKPENFLLTTPNDDALLKLADFGLSTYFKPSQRFRHIVGSAYYVAPEVLKRDYGYEADMWSLGVILYILLSGLPPFWGDTEEDIFKMVLKGKVDFKTTPWPQLSDAAKDCVKELLCKDPAKRPTAAQIMQHPWLKQQGVAPDTQLDSIVISRMRRFAAMNKLKKAALLVMARSMSPEDLSGLRQLFHSIDADGSGTITVDELRSALSRCGSVVQEPELAAVMSAADLDGSGSIDYEEFIAATVNLNRLEQETAFQKAFEHFDTDNSGYLTLSEIKAALKSFGVTDAEAKGMLEAFDTNQDGAIDYQEFLAMMQQNNQGLQAASSFFRDRTLAVQVTGSAAA